MLLIKVSPPAVFSPVLTMNFAALRLFEIAQINLARIVFSIKLFFR